MATKKMDKLVFSLSTKEEILNSIMIGLGESFVVPFALALSLPVNFIAILSSLPVFIGSVFQFLSLYLTKFLHNLKKLVLFSALFQSLVWLLFAFISYNIITNSDFRAFDLILIILFIVYFVFSMLFNSFWNSWVSGLVSRQNLANFYATINQYPLFFQLLALILAGFILNSFFSNFIFLGFFLIFLLAAIARLFSTYFLVRIPDSNSLISNPISLRKYFSNNKNSKYIKFSIFNFALMFGTHLAAPFFDVFMLKVLKFDYFTWSILVFSSGFIKILAAKYWSAIIKIFSPKSVLIACISAISLLPIFWLFTKDPFLLLLINIFSGFSWFGYDLLRSVYLLETNSNQTKIINFSLYQGAKAFAMLLGAILGGFLISYFQELDLDPFKPFYIVFLLSGLLRFLSIFLFVDPKSNFSIFEQKKYFKKIFYSHLLHWLLNQKISQTYFLFPIKKIISRSKPIPK